MCVCVSGRGTCQWSSRKNSRKPAKRKEKVGPICCVTLDMPFNLCRPRRPRRRRRRRPSRHCLNRGPIDDEDAALLTLRRQISVHFISSQLPPFSCLHLGSLRKNEQRSKENSVRTKCKKKSLSLSPLDTHTHTYTLSVVVVVKAHPRELA